MGTIQSKKREQQQALQSFEQSLAYRSALVAAHPSVTTLQVDLAMSHREIAIHQHMAGHDDKAIASAQQSIGIFDRLVQLHPAIARYRSELGRSLSTQGYIYDEKRENQQALPAYRRAVIEEKKAASASKDVNEYKLALSMDLENLGEQYVDLGQIDDGLPHYFRALEIRKQLHLNHPRNREYAIDLALRFSMIGSIHRQAGRAAVARESFTQARELLEQLAATHTGDTAISGALGAALIGEAVALAEEQKPEAARPLVARACQILRPLGGAANSGRENRERLSEALWQLARIERAFGNSTGAVQIDAERLDLWKRRPADELADLALKEAGRIALIGYGKTPVPEQARSIRKHDLDLAAADLRLAISQGFTNLSKLRAHPDASLLFARDDLKSLIRGLEASAGKPEQRH